ncbi:MAG: radical SAM protein [Bacillota bacterium]
MSISKEELRSIYFYLTNDCNLRCKHCWVAAGQNKEKGKEISSDEIKGIIDQAIPLGLKTIKLTGGEPLLRKDLQEILEYASTRNLSIIIETNATLLKPELAALLNEIKVTVSVSLDSHDPEEHDYFRGVQGSFALAIEGIKNLLKHDIPIELITCVHKSNYQKVDEIIKLGLSLGIKMFKFNQISLLGRAKTHLSKNELLTFDELIALNKYIDEELPSRYKAHIAMDMPLAFKSLQAIKNRRFFGCGIKNMLGILPNGDVSFCGIGTTIKELQSDNVRHKTIQSIWDNNPILQEIRRVVPRELEGVCSICIFKNYCQGRCRAVAFSHFGSLSAPVPICSYAYERGFFPKTRLIEKGRISSLQPRPR